MKLLCSYRFCLVAALLALPWMISNDSLWLDEGDTAMYAIQPDFHSWWDRLRHDGQADCQMPLSMLSAWMGGRLLGTQEWQMRAVNLVWGALAVFGIYRVGKRLAIPWLPVLLVVQPYFWFYQNEARPYSLQIAAGSWLAAGFLEFYFAQAAGTLWAWLLAGAAFFLFCGTLLAPLPVAATAAACGFIACRRGWKLSRKALRILLGGLMACVPVGLYHLSTLLRGSKGAQVWHVDLKFFAYVVYELMGLGGLGFSADDIRGLALSSHWFVDLSASIPRLVLPLLGFVLLTTILIAGLRCAAIDSSRRTPMAGLLIVLGLTAGVFLCGSLLMHKAFWARHYAAVFPVYVTLLGLAFAGLRDQSGGWVRLFPVLLCCALLFSALNFRFSSSLSKEDYRSAARFVRPLIEDNRSVWWLAGGYCASYYGLDCSFSNPEPKKVFVAFRSTTELEKLPPPDLIVYNKPYIHDPLGHVKEIIVQGHYEMAASFKSFTLWTNSSGASFKK